MKLAAFNQRSSNLLQRVFNRKSFVQGAQTPFEIVFDDGLSRMRRYKGANKPTRSVPILLVMPLAVRPSIYDLLQGQSLIQSLLNRGFDVYLTEWGEPDRRQTHMGFSDYNIKLSKMIKALQRISGSEQYTLHGWSMGGLFCLFNACTAKDPSLKNIILVGTPVDAHRSGVMGRNMRLLGQSFRKLEERTGLHPLMLPDQITHSHGWTNAIAFKALDPLGTLKSYAKLFTNLGDRDALIDNATKADFLLSMLDYPGRITKEVAENVWLYNKFFKAQMRLHGKLLDLKDIDCSLFVVAGSGDAIVTEDSARAVFDASNSTDTQFELARGGHVGILSSTWAADNLWPKMLDWLEPRS